MLIELDQKYVDVIVKRWQDYTGHSHTNAAALPLTVKMTGRLLFLSCFIKSLERRRKAATGKVVAS
jgi:hypothetical protein